MKCPYCGAEMEQGYVQSARGIFWSTKRRKLFILPTYEDVEIAPMSWTASANENSYLCRKCNKVIIDLH